MRTTGISFAVAALIYSASATQVEQTSTIATQVGAGWCDMNGAQQAALIKAQYSKYKSVRKAAYKKWSKALWAYKKGEIMKIAKNKRKVALYHAKLGMKNDKKAWSKKYNK